MVRLYGMETLADRSHTPKGRRARERILAAAEHLLTSHGFHGTSMRDVAAEAGLPLATTIYHFARKEQLYAAVLDRIGRDLAVAIDAVPDAEGFAVAIVDWTQQNPGRGRLLLRELLDNPARGARAAHLPLAPCFARAVALAGDRVRDPHAAVLHLVGGLSYVIAAGPTVDRLIGARRAERHYKAEAIAFARDVLGIEESRRGPRSPDSAHPSRARASRPQ